MYRWESGATVEGELNKLVWKCWYGIEKPIFGGVYSYTNPHGALAYECSQNQRIFTMSQAEKIYWDKPPKPYHTAIGLVRGTVKLWGEVIEHELGWRAQFAKLASIEEVWMGLGPQVEQCIKVLEPYRASLSL